MAYLLKGATITCPKCFKSPLELTQDVYEHMPIHACHFKSCVDHPDPIEHERIICYCCGEWFAGFEVINPMEGRFLEFLR